MINQTINDRYQLIEQVGSGGTAVVFHGIDTYTNDEVAVKILRPELAEDAELVHHFEREASAAAALSHPNLVKMRDVGYDPDLDLHYMVMNYIEGITLKEHIAKYGCLNPDIAAKITLDVAMGLQHAHSNGVVHRDIKPQNIIIDKDNNVKLTDFGIAHIVTDTTLSDEPSQDMIGTVYYTAPEQVKSLCVDARSDIYSLGVVLYEMVTGNVPFEGNTAADITMQHVTKEAESARYINVEVSLALDNIIKNAMAKRLENRYRAIDDMIRDLKKYLQNRNAIIPILQKPRPVKERIEIKKLPERKRQKRQQELNSILVNFFLIIVLTITLIGIGYVVVDFGKQILEKNFERTELEVPSVVGMKADDARELLKSNQLVYREIEHQYNASVPKGYIVSQSPKADEPVDADALVDVVVSLGAFIIDVPDFLGMDIINAEFLMRNNGYITGKYNYVESEAAKGTIISQSIEPGSHSLNGNTVQIVFDVSEGSSKTTIEMKNFVGYSYMSIEQLASLYNIRIGKVTYDYSDTAAKDTVISQSIEAGTEIARNSIVDFVISLGKRVDTEKELIIDISPESVSSQGTVFIEVKYYDKKELVSANEGNYEVENNKVIIKVKGAGTMNFYIYVNGVYSHMKEIVFN